MKLVMTTSIHIIFLKLLKKIFLNLLGVMNFKHLLISMPKCVGLNS